MHCVILGRQYYAFLNCFILSFSYINPCRVQSVVEVGGTHHSVLGAIGIDIKFGTLRLKYSSISLKSFIIQSYWGMILRKYTSL